MSQVSSDLEITSKNFEKIENGFQKNFSRVRALISMGHWGHTSNTYLLILIFIIK